MSDDNHTLPYPDAAAEHPTLVIPVPPPLGAAAPRTRPRWPWVLLIVVVVLAVLVVAAELIARAVLPGVVRSIVVEQLDLPADQQLDVETQGLPAAAADRRHPRHAASVDGFGNVGGHHGRRRCDSDGRPAARRRSGRRLRDQADERELTST